MSDHASDIVSRQAIQAELDRGDKAAARKRILRILPRTSYRTFNFEPPTLGRGNTKKVSRPTTPAFELPELIKLTKDELADSSEEAQAYQVQAAIVERSRAQLKELRRTVVEEIHEANRLAEIYRATVGIRREREKLKRLKNLPSKRSKSSRLDSPSTSHRTRSLSTHSSSSGISLLERSNSSSPAGKIHFYHRQTY